MSHKYGFEELTHKLFKEFMIMGKIWYDVILQLSDCYVF
jgi:hypothetical protein